MPPPPKPVFRHLSKLEAEGVLRTHSVGRLAFAFHDRVDIEPINYVYHDGWIYSRTAPGEKLAVLAHHPWVAFEVDDVHGLFEWTSVVAKGAVYMVDDLSTASGEESWEHAVSLLRRLIPTALTEHDPTPDRTVVFRMHVADLHGRQATMG
jgi:nitroimidazol reductase NimA-like FMN-containing flavoprotein (pyridoxamine 5'-phosphate oxidase superfamily)